MLQVLASLGVMALSIEVSAEEVVTGNFRVRCF